MVQEAYEIIENIAMEIGACLSARVSLYRVSWVVVKTMWLESVTKTLIIHSHSYIGWNPYHISLTSCKRVGV
jgi:hypothetical protein